MAERSQSPLSSIERSAARARRERWAWHVGLVLAAVAPLSTALSLATRATADDRGASELVPEGSRSGCNTPFAGHALSNDPSGATQPWWGVATSRARAGVIAVWRESAVMVSRDDGRTFQPLPASFQTVSQVEVGAHGTVFVLEADTITMQFPRAASLSRVPVPRAHEYATLAVGAGYLAYATPEGIWLSKDHGASWRAKRPPSAPVDVMTLSIGADGTLSARLNVHNCHSGDYDLYYGASLWGPWSEIEADVRWLGHGASHEVSVENDVVKVHETHLREQRRVVYELPDVTDGWPAAVHDEHSDYVQFGTQLYRLAEGKAELLDDELPEDLTLSAVDSCQRVLGLLESGTVVRWSKATGWRRLDVRNP
jgi:hypothetical protein